MEDSTSLCFMINTGIKLYELHKVNQLRKYLLIISILSLDMIGLIYKIYLEMFLFDETIYKCFPFLTTFKALSDNIWLMIVFPVLGSPKIANLLFSFIIFCPDKSWAMSKLYSSINFKLSEGFSFSKSFSWTFSINRLRMLVTAAVGTF